MLKKATWPTQLAVGDVLKELNGSRIYIVLKTGAGQRWTHLIDIEHEAKSAANRRAQPFKLKTDEVLLRLSPNVEAELALKKLEALPINVSERRRLPSFVHSRRAEIYRKIARDPTTSKGWGIITGLLTFDQPLGKDGSPAPPSIYGDAFEELLHRATRAKRIKRFCQFAGISESTVYRTFRRFCQQGMTPAAASDDYDRCGGRGKPRIWKNHPGRKAARRTLSASARTEEVTNLLAFAADYYFSAEYTRGKRSRKTLDIALGWVRATFLRDRVVYNEKKEMVELKLNGRIVLTRRQLQYYIYQNYTYEERRIREVGLRTYLLHERPLTGHLRNSRGPGEKYHIDATKMDIYLVGRILRTRVIGRPTLYLVIDDWSAMVVGFYVTFDPPSWNGAMMALVNAITPKVAFCHSLGVEITESQWPSHRLCAVLYGDQGEVSSVHKAHPLIMVFRVELQNPPAYRPDLRAVMERRFRLIPAIWNSLLPGIVEKDSFERGSEHPAYHAALNIEEIRRVVLFAVLSYNRRIIRGYPTPPEMVEGGYAPTPLNLWTYGTEVNGCGRHVDVADFRSKVMSTATVPIDAYGILHNGLHYACPGLSLLERQAMYRSKRKADTSVEICYDSADSSSIELLGLGAPISCPLIEGERDNFTGLTEQELAIYRELNVTNVGMAVEEEESHRAMTTYNIAKVGRDAVAETKAALVASGMTRLDISRMDESRQMERRVEERTRIAPGATGKRSRGDRNARVALSRGAAGMPATPVAEQGEIYDGEGDVIKDPACNRGASASENVQSTRELREQRARELLESIEE
ncbi:DDE-type integrase/transposase/recombinase [Burkholderia humptydooensis]|uniref:DDE-type integrase/transposase/recombinase n=2 Tax=Burkholderia humptydooensis TaxID=430531 RepID=A0A7U4P513_9BURK|nr:MULTISPECIES: helix-turn-helix transcriptional regulator [Burkholderia]AJY41491.1 integrase core domain protein [Burkholderia sp. 2002721687]ALX43109.1 integrase [Burkholderia humptydooensis]QPS44986.1 DDE-type integrase/transposase/recombinase [Burkholderia humptydooensis]